MEPESVCGEVLMFDGKIACAPAAPMPVLECKVGGLGTFWKRLLPFSRLSRRMSPRLRVTLYHTPFEGSQKPLRSQSQPSIME